MPHRLSLMETSGKYCNKNLPRERLNLITIYPIIKDYFYTNSQVVYGDINNNAKRFKVFVANRVQLSWKHSEPSQWTYIEDLKEAEMVTLKLYQKMEFKDEYKLLSQVKTSEGQKLENRLICLNPFKNKNHLVCIGGRIRQLSLELGVVHPVLLSEVGNAIKINVRWCHERATHSGRNITLIKPRSSSIGWCKET